MGTFKRIALAGLAAVATSAPALAADLLPPPPPAPIPVPVDVGSGWYLRGDVGVGVLDFDKFEGVNVVTPPGFLEPPGGYRLDSKSIGDQVFVGAGFGYQLNNWFRFDVTGEYRTQAELRTTESYSYFGEHRASDTVRANLSSFVGLANAYVDFGNWHGVTPFIGAGVGFAHHNLKGVVDHGISEAFTDANGVFHVATPIVSYGSDRSDTRFAWALHAGLGYAVTSNLKLELAYRYLNMGKAQAVVCGSCNLTTAYSYKDLDSHDFKLGMRWMFGAPAPAPILAAAEPAPMPMPGPIVRKY